MVQFNAEQAAGRAVLDFLKDHKLGSLTKQEADLALLGALVASGRVDLDSSAFQLGKQLRCTPARVRNLILAFRMRNAWNLDLTDAQKRNLSRDPLDGSGDTELQRYATVLREAKFARSGDKIEILVTDPFIKEIAIEQIERRKHTAELGRNASILLISVEAFLDEVDNILTEKNIKHWKTELAKDDSVLLRTDVAVLKEAFRTAARTVGGERVGALWDLVTHYLEMKVEEHKRGAAA